MKEFKRIISLAMVLILCVSLLPMNQNLLKAEAQLDDSTKLKNIILRVYDGKEWTNAVYTSEFDPNNREYTINLDIKYKKVQFYFEKANDDQVIEAKDKNMCPVRDSNYTEEYSLRPQDNTFWFYVKSSNGSKVREYVFKVKKGIEDNAHNVSATGGNRDLPKAFGGDIVKYYAEIGTGSKIFDHWITISNNVVLDDPNRIMGEFIMPNSEAEIKAQFKDGSDDGSKLRYIIVHAMKDNVWETFYDAVKIKDDTKEYELDLNEGYTDFYLTLQTEDYVPYYENENHREPGDLLRNSNKHIKIQANSSELKIADCQYGFRTEKSSLNKGENVLNFKIISKNSKNTSEYTLKINNGEVKYTVTFNPNEGSGDMDGKLVKAGEDFELPDCTFTAPEGKEFKAWSVDGQEKEVGAKITINRNTEVKVIWKVKPITSNPEDKNKKYEIKLTQASNGTIIINPTEAKEGELVTVQAVPDYGYEFESIIILDENQNSVSMKANQFTMPKGGVSIYAKFKELAFAIYPEIEEEKPIENKRHRRDWRYDRYDEDKNTNEEEKSKAEKEIKSDESKTIITIGSQTLEKVMNGVRTVKNMDSAPYIKRGRTMLPLRYLAEALGYKVFWLNETKTVVIVDLGLRVEIHIDTNLIIVNGIKYTSDLKPEIVCHRTMLPIANIARALGLKDGEDILWDEVNRQVTINKKSYK